MTELTIKTLKVRVRDKHGKALRRQAAAVNFVWNFINELSSRSIRERGIFLSAYDIQRYTNGAGKELGLHSHTVQRIGAEYVTRRQQFRKQRLAWRKTAGVRRSLGWIPVNTGQAKWKNGQVFFHGQHYKVWDSHGLSQHRFRSATFSEDARGRWYFNVVVEVPVEQSAGTGAVGIDLGCKDAAICSNGEKLTGRWYRAMEDKLAVAQRARKKQRVKAIHAKVANRRKDAMHQFSRRLVNENAAIFVGNINTQAITKTRMAKSSLDAGWGILKTMLEYKCAGAGVVFGLVDERYTTVTCSACNSRTGPSGLEGLRIREWTCRVCGVIHGSRDVNAARNILALGHERLAGGITVSSGR
ncbi:RNA-guided endonuclease InsQ/TnpB family protein [Marinobacter sp. P4B1]|uniref:RNA-guided endonuclease InsQ/TnpB family protein n=1 Tax=Marinobacter sp. P4B1 TaxID=1119533 RepID=UPI00071C3DD9|nr:RNA-guided endonuclease TnpB family protein [Marinobacter sp. P4B1]KRW83651.1 transposase [Marinobacter sp. P4B1]